MTVLNGRAGYHCRNRVQVMRVKDAPAPARACCIGAGAIAAFCRRAAVAARSILTLNGAVAPVQRTKPGLPVPLCSG
mgnify:CR=1 FL=1